MERNSTTTARPAGGGRQRRRAAGLPVVVADAPGLPGVVPEVVGVAEDRSDTTYSENAPKAAALADHAEAPPAEAASAAPTGAAGAAPSGLRLWLGRARALGLTEPELVFELHARQGLPLLAVAHVLGLNLETVRGHWLQGRTARAAQAPQSEADFSLLREHLCEVLWQTVEATYPAVSLTAADADAGPPAPPSPPMLSVRLKALDQIAKLYDLSVEQLAASSGPLPYATPEDIANEVRQRVLEMHGREPGMEDGQWEMG